MSPKKSWVAMAAVLVLGVVLGWAIVQRDRAAPSGDAHDHPQKQAPGDPTDEADQDHEHGHEDEQAASHVTLSEAQLKQAAITLAMAGPARIAIGLPLAGEVHYNGDRTVQVVPRQAGLVQSVSANAGDRVKKGQVLAVLSSPALADQRAQASALQQRLTLARSTFEREKKLWEEKISAEQDYLQAKAAWQEAEIAERNLRHKLSSLGIGTTVTGDLTRFELRSPIDGVVTDKRITVGQSLGESEAVFTVSDLSSVWVEVPVAPKDLAMVRTGQAVQVKSAALQAQASSVIGHVSALLGEQTRSAMARIVLPNPQGLWRPGLPVDVMVSTSQTEAPLAVQSDAVQRVGEQDVVFVRQDGDEWAVRPVKLGRSDGRFTEVLQGLKTGERYAATNSFVIKAELGKAGASHEH